MCSSCTHTHTHTERDSNMDALIDVASFGDLDRVMHLLNEGMDVNIQNKVWVYMYTLINRMEGQLYWK